MSEVIKILIERDGLSESDAQEVFDEVLEEIEDCVYCCDLTRAEDVLMSELRLEPDYLDEFLNKLL
jgi:hypothetical protein